MTETLANSLKIRDYVYIKGRPAKIVDIAYVRSSKYPMSNIHFIGLDIFTQNKLELDIKPSHKVECPIVTYMTYNVLCIINNYIHCTDALNNRYMIIVPSNDLGAHILKVSNTKQNIRINVVSVLMETKILNIDYDDNIELL